MAVNEYLKMADGYIIDLETYKFIPDSQAKGLVNVPFFLWDTWEPYEGMRYSRVKSIHLNELHIDFAENGYFPTIIKYYDNGLKRAVCIELVALAQTVGTFIKDGNRKVLEGVHFLCTVDDVNKNYQMSLSDEPRFWYVHTLGYKEETQYVNDRFSYGMREKPFELQYKRQKLKGQYYAVLYGPWAIILSDDLKFDALVFLNGVMSHLSIEKIVYAANPYFVKLLTLLN